MSRRVRRAGFVVAAVALAVACSHLPQAPSTKRTLSFVSEASVNGGKPFYVVVRGLTEREFLLDGYDKVAGMAFPGTPEDGILALRMVWPGRTEELELNVDGDNTFAVYALFTKPGEPWRVLLSPPLDDSYRFRLETDGTISDSSRDSQKF